MLYIYIFYSRYNTDWIAYTEIVMDPNNSVTKFRGNWPTGSGEEDLLKVFAIYSHGGHLGHVTWTIYINFRSPFLRMLHMKFGFDWPSGFRGEDL